MSARGTNLVPVKFRRCAVCGHPNQEHRGTLGCTVPRCECDDFVELELHPSKQTPRR